MNKKDLISKAAEVLRNNNIRKPISTPKQVFHISDDDGNHKDFVVKKTDKTVMYNTNDISAILDACLCVIEDSIKRGEEVYIHGFGTFDVHHRAARSTRHPETGEIIEISSRYVPKFSFGNNLRKAAKIYELSLDDFSALPSTHPRVYTEEGDGDE